VEQVEEHLGLLPLLCMQHPARCRLPSAQILQVTGEEIVDREEPNYRTDEQLRHILAGSGGCAAINPLESITWLSANLQSVLGLVGDPAQGELLKKIVAGFDVSPIK